MSFLDRFKPQPKWKHADPGVRAASIPDIPDDAEHLVVLQELAREDADLRVRRAAGARLSRVEDVVQLARSERDEELKREYADRLVGIATAPAPTDAGAALALDGLEEQKHFASIAKSSPHGNVRAAALGRVHDAKMLSSVARHATDGQTAADAAARIPDAAELLSIALKTEHKDAGVAALERAVEAGGTEREVRQTLDGVIARARSKSVAKRARAIIQSMDEAEAARRLAHEQWQQRVSKVVTRVESIAAAPVVDGSSAQFDEAEEEWRTVTADGGYELDPATSARFVGLVAKGRGEIDRLAREEAEHRAAAERREALVRSRNALCERVEQARGEGTLSEIDNARTEWTALGALDSSVAGDTELHKRFEAACRRGAERHERREEIQRMAVRLGELSVNAEQLAARADAPEVDWNVLSRDWQTLRSQVEDLDPAVQQRFADAEAVMHGRAEERRAAAERTLKQSVQRIDQLIERAVTRAAAEDLTLREADRIGRDLRNALEAPPMLPRAEQQQVLDRLKEAQGVVAPKVHELREMDEWKRFANAAVQEEMIARAEALRAKFPFDKPEELKPEHLDEAARELHDIQERWKLAADAPRAQAQALWHRYRQAADPVQVKVREFFAVRAGERKANLEIKMALIARAEALADSSDWAKTADELKKLQTEWQAVGSVPRQESRDTWNRFRQACDTFFTRRNADLTERKETWSANLAKKEALCARAEELSTSMNWESAASEMRRMQTDWKGIGPVRRSKSEVIWQRFRTAADTFFDRYKRRDEIELESKQADREALVTEVEALATGATSAEPAAVLEQVRSLRTRWNQSTPVVRQGADPLSARFMDALERLLTGAPEAFKGTELDAAANRERMEKLVVKVEGLSTESADAPDNSGQALAARLREALASNTIGGKAGEEAKWKALAEDVRQAQAAWSRLGPVPGDGGREMTDRFLKACSRFFEVYRRKVPPQTGGGGGGERRNKPVGTR
ncbi:MAG TPA: DUF349 domain-containing protein [Vicinamibacterales bacterium]|nr:DUF349 domain-containing protein [Vicinamibacterales bacterium]